MIQGLNPGWGKRFFFLPKSPDQLWGHPVSYLMGTGIHLLPRLRMNGAIPLLLLYTFMA
jgi:hypothetical protein